MKQIFIFLLLTFISNCYSQKQSNFDVSQYEGIDLSGNRVVLSELLVRRLAINVYAPTCIPCVKEIPALNYLFQEVKKDKKKDRLELIGIYPAKNKYQKGQLYVYTLGKGKTDSEQWAIAFVAASNKEINTDVEVLSLNSVPDASKSKEENIQELIAEFSLTFRKRAVTADVNSYYQGY
jgi:thiol-disulfide isomerase/thioredoxin